MIINRCMTIGNLKTRVDLSMCEATEKRSMDQFRPAKYPVVVQGTKVALYRVIIIVVAWLIAMKYTVRIT